VAAVQYYGTGRRKTSTARVFLRPGSGAISINRRTFEGFFPTESLRTQIRRPLVLTETGDKFDILATVAGGGVSGQAGAVRLGISRALVEYNLALRKSSRKKGSSRATPARRNANSGMAGARKRFPVQQTVKHGAFSTKSGGLLAAIAMKDLLEAGFTSATRRNSGIRR
jgi:small subunit ribosomal protein S9